MKLFVRTIFVRTFLEDLVIWTVLLELGIFSSELNVLN